MANKNLGFVDWYEGMVIRPQHFQQAFFSILAQNEYLLKHTTTHMYGVIDFELNVSGDGSFFLKKIDCIMPDYSIVSIKGDKALSIQCNLDDFYLYLCTKENYTERFESEASEPIADVHDSASEAIINRLVIRPFLSVEPTANCIPIAKYKMRSKEKFDPPSPYFTSCAYSCAILKSLMDRMRELIAQATTRSEVQRNDEEMKAYGFVLLKCYLTIDKAFNNSMSDPVSVFSAVVDGVVNLIGIGNSKTPKLGPSGMQYDHGQIFNSFFYLFEYLNEKLNDLEIQYKDGVGKFRLIEGAREAFVYSVLGSGARVLFHLNKIASPSEISAFTICFYPALQDTLIKTSHGFARQILSQSELKTETMVEVKIDFPPQADPVELCIVPTRKGLVKSVFLLGEKSKLG